MNIHVNTKLGLIVLLLAGFLLLAGCDMAPGPAPGPGPTGPTTPTTSTVSIMVDSATDTAEGAMATFTVTASPAPSANLSITYTVSATAATGDDDAEVADFGVGTATMFPTGTVMIMADETMGTISLPIFSDTVDGEARESYTVTITRMPPETSAYTIGTASADGSIAADPDCTEDVETDDICVDGDAEVSEGDSAMFRVRLKGMTGRRPLMIMYTVSATTATTDDDAEIADFANAAGEVLSSYPSGTMTIPASTTVTNPSVVVRVPIFNDTLSERAEAFTFAIAFAGVSGTIDSVNTTIAASDPITVVVNRTSNSSVIAGRNAEFRVSLTDDADTPNLLTIGADLTIGFTVAGRSKLTGTGRLHDARCDDRQRGLRSDLYCPNHTAPTQPGALQRRARV